MRCAGTQIARRQERSNRGIWRIVPPADVGFSWDWRGRIAIRPYRVIADATVIAKTGCGQKNGDPFKAPPQSFFYTGPNTSPSGDYVLAAPQTVSMMSRVTTYGSQLAFGRRSSM